MGSLPLVVMPDLKRFQEFKPKFEQKLQQELRQLATLLETPTPSTVVVRVQTRPLTSVLCNIFDVLNGRTTAAATTSTQPPAKPVLPSTSNGTQALSLTPPPGQNSQAASKPIDQSNQSDSNSTDLLSAFKAAKNLLENVFGALQQGPKETSVNRCPTSFSPADFFVRYSAQKGKAMELLKKAAAHDQEAEKRATQLFECANHLKYEEAVMKSRQREHMETTMRNLIQKRFSFDRLQVSWLETCNTPEETERLFLADDDPLELELVKGFGNLWDAFYWKLKKDKAMDFFRAVEFLREYRIKMMCFLASRLCVSVRDFHWAHRETCLMMKTPLTNWVNLKPKLEQLMEELKKPLLEKVLRNIKSEEACVAKAVEYACEKYRETMWAELKEDGKMEHLHRTIYEMIRRCFESVDDFEYSKLWYWPYWDEGPRIKQYIKEAQEENERRRVTRIKEQAAALLEQLEPDQLVGFWRDRFPQLRVGGGSAQSLPSRSFSTGPEKRLAIEGPSTSNGNAEVDILAVKRAKRDDSIDRLREVWEEIKPAATSAPSKPPTSGSRNGGRAPASSAPSSFSAATTSTSRAFSATKSTDGTSCETASSQVGNSPSKGYNLRTFSKPGPVPMKAEAVKEAVNKCTVTVLGPGMYHNRVATAPTAPPPDGAKSRQVAQRPESAASTSSSSA